MLLIGFFPRGRWAKGRGKNAISCSSDFSPGAGGRTGGGKMQYPADRIFPPWPNGGGTGEKCNIRNQWCAYCEYLFRISFGSMDHEFSMELSRPARSFRSSSQRSRECGSRYCNRHHMKPEMYEARITFAMTGKLIMVTQVPDLALVTLLYERVAGALLMAKSRFRLSHGCELLPNASLDTGIAIPNAMKQFSFRRNVDISCARFLPAPCFRCVAGPGISICQPVERVDSFLEVSDYTYAVWCRKCWHGTWEYGYRKLRFWRHICFALLARQRQRERTCFVGVITRRR